MVLGDEALRSSRITCTQWLTLAAAIITIIVGLLTLLRLITYPWVGIILASCYCIFLAGSWILLIVQDIQYKRKARMAEANIPLHKAYHYLRNAWYSWRTGATEEPVLEIISRSLREFASAFSIITGAHCRTCIKTTYIPNELLNDVDGGGSIPSRSWAAQTYCRSDDAKERCHESGHDWIDDNSDYEELMKADHEPGTRRFFCNNLPYPGYKNSHYSSSEMKEGKMAYSATIVWPIQKKLKDSPHDLLGFLCIDSKTRNVFMKGYDEEIGASYADALYMFLQPVLAQNNPELRKEKEHAE